MADRRAHAAVSKAIRDGKLPRVTDVACTDCGSMATMYDHYLGYGAEHWLDVEPVCAACNTKRSYAGRGLDGGDLRAVLFHFPREIVEALDAEARSEERSRNRQVNWILRERYRPREREISESMGRYMY